MSELNIINALKDCVRLLLIYDPNNPIVINAVKVLKKDKANSRDKQWLTQSFDTFWKEYPLKRLKKQAKEQWNKLNPDKVLFEEIILQLDMQKKYKKYLEQQKEFSPQFQDAVRWIKNERWTDETPFVKPKSVTLNRGKNGKR